MPFLSARRADQLTIPEKMLQQRRIWGQAAAWEKKQKIQQRTGADNADGTWFSETQKPGRRHPC
jgi:hypothetical protein